MPNDLILPVVPGQLPVGFCPNTYQDMLNGYSSVQTVTFPNTFAGVTVSASKPADTEQAWLQLDTIGRPTRLYYFSQGAWLSQHPSVPGMIQIWVNALPDFTTFDGGDANALSAISGPMWQVAVDASTTPITARFPIAVGTLPSLLALAVGDKGGEENHSLTLAESAPHSHTVPIYKDGMNIPDFVTGHGVVLGESGTRPGGLPLSTLPTDTQGGTGSPAVVSPHNTMPPYIAVYFLQRTSRLFYSVP